MVLETEIKRLIGFKKHRWYFEIYCLKCGTIIARKHKRPMNYTQKEDRLNWSDQGSYLGYDFFNPSSCVCGELSFVWCSTPAVTFQSIVEALGVFKVVSH